MIELTRCGAPDNDRYLPAVMTQGDASTYQTMIDNSSVQTRPQQMVGRAFGSAQGGTTQNGQQQGMAPSAVSNQLRALRQARLITVRRDGRMLYYRLADCHPREIISLAMSHVKEEDG